MNVETAVEGWEGGSIAVLFLACLHPLPSLLLSSCLPNCKCSLEKQPHRSPRVVGDKFGDHFGDKFGNSLVLVTSYPREPTSATRKVCTNSMNFTYHDKGIRRNTEGAGGCRNSFGLFSCSAPLAASLLLQTSSLNCFQVKFQDYSWLEIWARLWRFWLGGKRAWINCSSLPLCQILRCFQVSSNLPRCQH